MNLSILCAVLNQREKRRAPAPQTEAGRRNARGLPPFIFLIGVRLPFAGRASFSECKGRRAG